MSDKAALVREARDAFAELGQAIEGLDGEALRRVWLGTWGVREIVIHISGWHRAMIPALAHVARGEPPYPAGTYDDFDAWNARFVAAQAGAKVDEVLGELRASHEDFLAAVAAVPESDLAEGSVARGLLDGAGTGHYREHTTQIRDWRRATAV